MPYQYVTGEECITAVSACRFERLKRGGRGGWAWLSLFYCVYPDSGENREQEREVEVDS